MSRKGVEITHPILMDVSRASSDDDLSRLIHKIKQDYPTDATIAAQLATILAASGQYMELNSAVVADVASTGGPSSLSTLLTPLLLKSGTAIVPKLGVPGHPAGGIDSLAQIPGYRCTLSMGEAASIIERCGYAHFVADSDAAPLDGRMFKIRQQLGAKNIPTLVAASLLAKKLAVGITHAGLDIRVSPHGSFGHTWDTAAGNARLFNATGHILGIKTFPVLTEGQYPYQPYIGRKESLWAMTELLQGTNDEWLKEHMALCIILAQSAVPEELRVLIAQATNITLKMHLYEHLEAQQGSGERLEEVVDQTRKAHCFEVRSPASGWTNYPLVEIKNAIAELNRLATSGEAFPDATGIRILIRPGTWVSKGDTIATLRAPQDIAHKAMSEFQRILTPVQNCEGTQHKQIYE